MSKLKQAGELHDLNGVPIYPGDLLRSYSFTEPRGRKFYLYHTAVLVDGYMRMIPTSHLEPTLVSGGGSCWITQALASNSEVINGHGPGDCLDWTEREKVKL